MLSFSEICEEKLVVSLVISVNIHEVKWRHWTKH